MVYFKHVLAKRFVRIAWFFPKSKMNIPKYKLKGWLNHFQRLIDSAKYDVADTRAANAFRLAKKDVQQIKKILDKEND